mgnify:CR=1 FL=1
MVTLHTKKKFACPVHLLPPVPVRSAAARDVRPRPCPWRARARPLPHAGTARRRRRGHRSAAAFFSFLLHLPSPSSRARAGHARPTTAPPRSAPMTAFTGRSSSCFKPAGHLAIDCCCSSIPARRRGAASGALAGDGDSRTGGQRYLADQRLRQINQGLSSGSLLYVHS